MWQRRRGSPSTAAWWALEPNHWAAPQALQVRQASCPRTHRCQPPSRPSRQQSPGSPWTQTPSLEPSREPRPSSPSSTRYNTVPTDLLKVSPRQQAVSDLLWPSLFVPMHGPDARCGCAQELAAQGKLPQGRGGGARGGAAEDPGIFREVRINDAPAELRHHLTKRPTQASSKPFPRQKTGLS